MSITISVNAQSARKSTNPYIAAELEEMRHPGKASGPVSLSFDKGNAPFQRFISPAQREPGTADAGAKYSPVHPDAQNADSVKFPGFYAPPYISVTAVDDSNSVYTSAGADFDGKNGPDLVTVQFDGTLNLMTNDGHGRLARTYSDKSAVVFNPNVAYIEVADLNKDGYPDVVAVDANNSAFLVFLNKGDGTFADATSVSVSPASGASFINGGTLAVADVNGDGIPDVVTVTNLQNGNDPSSFTTIFSQQTFIGKGDGTFTTPRNSTDAAIPGFFYVQFGQGLALADLNGDHIPDLVTEYFDAINDWVTVSGSLGKGNGAFSPIGPGATVRGALQTESTLQVADLNGDGKQDAIYIFGDSNAYVALGKGDGTFSSPASVLQNIPGAALIRLGDFNADGCPDLLVYGAGSIAVYAGGGDATFNPVPAGQYGGDLTGDQQPLPADYDGDGKLDFAFVDSYYGTVSIYKGLGDGSFAAQRAVAPSNSSTTLPNNLESANNYVVLATGDVNGDGKTDVLAYDYTHPFEGPYGTYPDVNVGLSDGKNGFTFSTIFKGHDLYLANASAVAPVIADFNHDGYADLIVETANGISIALGKPDGTVGSPQAISLPVAPKGCSFANVDVGDINNDGNPDVLIANNGASPKCAPEPVPSGYFVLLGDGKGGFKATFTGYGKSIYQARLVDLNGDGVLDLAVDNGYQTSGLVCNTCPTPITVLRGKGDGTFDTANAYPILDEWRIGGLVLGDYDADGRQDLTLLSYGQIDPGSGIVPDSEGILLLKGRGDFTFEEPVLVAAGAFAANAQYADFNSDGLPDLAFSLDTTFQSVPTYFGLVVLPNLGSGSFGKPLNFLAPLVNTNTMIGDFNGDGMPDVLIAPYRPISPSIVYLNQGGSTLSLTATPAAASQGDNITLQATLSVLPGTATPTGSVSFSTNGTLLGTTDLTGGSVAELTTSELPVGTDAIVATYSGDANHNPSTAQAVSVSVQALAPTFTVNATPQTLSLTAGQSGTVTLDFTANAAFNGQITVSCSGLPIGASCAFEPASLTLSGGHSGTISAVVSTVGPTQARMESQRPGQSPGWMGGAIGGLALAQGIVLMWPMRRRRTVRALAAWTDSLLCLVFFMALPGCSGGSNSSSEHGNSGTPTGSSLVTITATATSGGASLKQTAIVSITVKN